MRTPKKRVATIAAIATALIIGLAACTQTTPVVEPTPKSTTETKQPTATAKPKECAKLTGEEALKKWAGAVETSRPWDLAGEYSDVRGYDACAEISWIVLRPAECCTVFEITPIMFFHRGEYVPAATITDRAIDRQTTPERHSDNAISLTFATPAGANTPPTLTTTKYAWDEKSGTIIATEPKPAAEAGGGDANGHWCPTVESKDTAGCVTIALPTATYANGETTQLTDRGDVNGDGSTSYTGPGAPFGTFYPAGTPITIPDYYSGADLPDQDRIWNGQTGVMLVRK